MKPLYETVLPQQYRARRHRWKCSLFSVIPSGSYPPNWNRTVVRRRQRSSHSSDNKLLNTDDSVRLNLEGRMRNPERTIRRRLVSGIRSPAAVRGSCSHYMGGPRPRELFLTATALGSAPGETGLSPRVQRVSRSKGVAARRIPVVIATPHSRHQRTNAPPNAPLD